MTIGCGEARSAQFSYLRLDSTTTVRSGFSGSSYKHRTPGSGVCLLADDSARHSHSKFPSCRPEGTPIGYSKSKMTLFEDYFRQNAPLPRPRKRYLCTRTGPRHVAGEASTAPATRIGALIQDWTVRTAWCSAVHSRPSLHTADVPMHSIDRAMPSTVKNRTVNQYSGASLLCPLHRLSHRSWPGNCRGRDAELQDCSCDDPPSLGRHNDDEDVCGPRADRCGASHSPSGLPARV
jgi:hypothetical protein